MPPKEWYETVTKIVEMESLFLTLEKNMEKDKKFIQSPYFSLEELSDDPSLTKRGLIDLSAWSKIKEPVENLKVLFKAGKISEGIIVSEEILNINSNHFFTLCYYGRFLYLVGRYEESFKIFHRCLQEKKQYYFLWSFYADALYKLERYPEAAENYDKALKLELYKVWYIANEKNIDTNKDFKQPPKQLSTLDNYLYYCNEGETLDETGYFRRAQYYLSTRAGIYDAYKENDIGKKRAIEALKEVLKLNPQNWFARNEIVVTLQSLAEGQIVTNRKESLDNINIGLEYDNENINLILTKAILLNRGDKEEAIRLIDSAKKNHPDHDGIDFIFKKINDLE